VIEDSCDLTKKFEGDKIIQRAGEKWKKKRHRAGLFAADRLVFKKHGTSAGTKEKFYGECQEKGRERRTRTPLPVLKW